MKNQRRVFVTVGTTKFRKLIDNLSTKTALNVFLSLGYNYIQFQTGEDPKEALPDLALSEKWLMKTEGESHYVVNLDSKMTLKYDKFFDNFEEEVLKSDLVISHAGAGTCLEVLHKHKPLLVVINEDLMNNHQAELAQQLQEDGYLYCCTCDTLVGNLRRDFNELKCYPFPEKHLFSRYLNRSLGFDSD